MTAPPRPPRPGSGTGRVGPALAAAGIVASVLAPGFVAPAVAAPAKAPIVVVDGTGRVVDPARDHLSPGRRLPARLRPRQSPPGDEAFRFVVRRTDGGPLPPLLRLTSYGLDGERLDDLGDVPARALPCPKAVAAPRARCVATGYFLGALDLVDRLHPAAKGAAIRLQVGGRVEVTVPGGQRVVVPVGGPPRPGSGGAAARSRLRIRARVVRDAPRGALPFGRSEKDAVELARRHIAAAGDVLGQCGISFGAAAELDVAVVEPPPTHLLALGCGLGMPSSGGVLKLRVAGRPLTVAIPPGRSPASLAHPVARALRRLGHRVVVSPNVRPDAAALPSVDLLVADRQGRPVELAPVDATPVSTDPTLGVCLGTVDLTDGLTHFGDHDASTGTVEERSLMKFLDDGDPSTVEVVFINAFARTGRIGESFIHVDGAAIRNAVIVDRTGVDAGARSFTLAHELGHILLDMPGHPDDFGVDRSDQLMDADASDPTIFGPRRLSRRECDRMLRQSGPGAPTRLLEPWPLRPRPSTRGPSIKRRPAARR